jgi:predicted ATPase
MATTFALTRELLDEAYKQKVSLSEFLEREDPTAALPLHEQHMDAFERQLARLDIRTSSDFRYGPSGP